MLRVSDFSQFFFDLHGYEPFPIQRRVVEAVAAGRTPVVTSPCGTGKGLTSVNLSFLAACEDVDFGEHFRRFFHLVDRRTLVDDSYEEGCKLAKALATPTTPLLRDVASRFSRMAVRDTPPIASIKMRGAIKWRDDYEVVDPSQYALVSSTVDQFGSQLLFGGYGVAQRMRPIYAAMAGAHSFAVLDEADSSEVFLRTLYQIKAIQDRSNPGLFSFLPMSATIRPLEGTDALTLDEQDWAHPILGPRLRASKKVTLVECSDGAVDATLASQAARLITGGARTVAVYSNQARRTESIRKLIPAKLNADVVVLTGQTRPIDAKEILAKLMPRVARGRDRSADSRPLVLVTTQAMEVGNNADFDAIVSEAADAQALIQRAGRLDRDGLLGETPFIVVKGSKLDPIYGESANAMFMWLSSGNADLGTWAMQRTPPPNEAYRCVTNDLIFDDIDLEVLAATNGDPSAAPDISMHLHGMSKPAVQVAWRADLTSDNADSWEDIVRLVPPSPDECLRMPLGSFYRILNQVQGASCDSDLEGVGDEVVQPQTTKAKAFVVWGGKDTKVRTFAQGGDTIVLPVEYGFFGNIHQEDDRAEESSNLPYVLRIQSDVLSHWKVPQQEAQTILDCLVEHNREGYLRALSLLGEFAEQKDSPPFLKSTVERFQRLRFRAFQYPDESGVVLRAREPVLADDAPNDSSLTGTRATLLSHSEGVGDFARRFADKFHLPPHIKSTVELAALIHDIGKLHPSFQKILEGGTPSSEPLAKSAPNVSKRTSGVDAGYPQYRRHEFDSYTLCAQNGHLFPPDIDQELLRWLIVSHHGYGHPYMPTWKNEETTHPTSFSVAGMTFQGVISNITTQDRIDIIESHDRLMTKYGVRLLYWMETVVRRSDHFQSYKESQSHAQADDVQR